MIAIESWVVLDSHMIILPICSWFTLDYISHLLLIHLDYIPYPFVLDSHLIILPICSWFTLDYIAHLFLICTILYFPFVFDSHMTILPIYSWFTLTMFPTHLFLIHTWLHCPFVSFLVNHQGSKRFDIPVSSVLIL